MENISKHLKLPVKPTTDANSERADVIGQLMAFMGEDIHNGRRFKYWLGRTKRLSPGEIFGLMKRSREEGKKPRALFNWLLKSRLSTPLPKTSS